jgi:hypothetical protein
MAVDRELRSAEETASMVKQSGRMRRLRHFR